MPTYPPALVAPFVAEGARLCQEAGDQATANLHVLLGAVRHAQGEVPAAWSLYAAGVHDGVPPIAESLWGFRQRTGHLFACYRSMAAAQRHL